MIEQFMIAANVAVAALARRKKLPFVYRVHAQPDPEKLKILADLARSLGMKTALPEEISKIQWRSLMEEAGKPLMPVWFPTDCSALWQRRCTVTIPWGIMDWRWRTIAILPRLYGAIPTWPYIGFCPMCWHTPLEPPCLNAMKAFPPRLRMNPLPAKFGR